MFEITALAFPIPNKTLKDSYHLNTFVVETLYMKAKNQNIANFFVVDPTSECFGPNSNPKNTERTTINTTNNREKLLGDKRNFDRELSTNRKLNTARTTVRDTKYAPDI